MYRYYYHYFIQSLYVCISIMNAYRICLLQFSQLEMSAMVFIQTETLASNSPLFGPLWRVNTFDIDLCKVQ